MKKKNLVFLTAAAMLFFSTNLLAQTTEKGKWRVNFGLEGGRPTGALNRYSDIMGGATLRVQHGLSDRLALTFTSGYYNFFSKRQPLIGGPGTFKPDDIGIVPVKVGVKSFISRGFYLGAEAGAGFETPGGPVKLILSPGFGFAGRSWDAGLRYEHFSQSREDFGMVALRVAYGFSLPPTKFKAQTTEDSKWRMSVGFESGLSTHDDTMVGGTLKLEHNLWDKTALTFTTGYYNFLSTNFYKSSMFDYGHDGDFGVVPVKAGVKSFLLPKLYVSGELGAGFRGGNKGAGFIYSPGIGFATRSFDIGARYESIDNIKMVGLRLA